MDSIYGIIIILVIAIVAIVLIIKFLKKVVKIVAISITVVGIGLYLLYVAGVFQVADVNVNNVEYSFSIHDLRDKYCVEADNYRDSVKCNIIITPIYEDILNNYSEKELKQMEWNKFKMLVAIKKSVKAKKSDIHDDLKDINALYLWNDFNNDFSSGNLLEKNK